MVRLFHHVAKGGLYFSQPLFCGYGVRVTALSGIIEDSGSKAGEVTCVRPAE